MNSPGTGAGRVLARIAATVALLATFPPPAAAQPTWVPNDMYTLWRFIHNRSAHDLVTGRSH
jgi:hypothetical protein